MADELLATIETVQRHLAAAEEAGHPYESHLHRVRLAELEQRLDPEAQLLD